MKSGIAYSTNKDSVRAGLEAATQAVESSGPPQLTILFTTDAYNQNQVLEAVRKLVGDSRLVGFCGGGIITQDGVFPQGVGVCTMAGKELAAVTALQRGLSKNPREAGEKAGEALLASGLKKGTVIVLPDGFQSNLSEMLRGLYHTMGPAFTYVGGGAGDNLKFFKTYQFTEQGIDSDALAVALLDGVPVISGLGHGWQPMGEPLVITKSKDKTVEEIDGVPAFQAYLKRLGHSEEGQFAQVGMKHPLGFPDISGNYLIRDPLTVNGNQSIHFVTEIPRNAVGNIMDCSMEELIGTAAAIAKKVVSGMHHPVHFVLLFDCISRFLLMGARFNDEIRAIREVIGPDTPLLGALTFGEVGSYLDIPLLHNKTTVIAMGGDRIL